MSETIKNLNCVLVYISRVDYYAPMRIFIVFISLLSIACYADIYRSVDNNGNIIFSDTPADNSEPVTIDIAPSYQPPEIVPLETKNTDKNKQQTLPVPTYKISITSPVQNQTFQNPEIITVTAVVEPELDIRRADKIVFKLDGKQITKPQSQLSTTLENIERGSHILAASVVDTNGKIIKSSKSVLFHVQRHSVLLHKNN